MNARLILSFSGSGQFQACLVGKGKYRKMILSAFEKYIEGYTPIMKQKIQNALRNGYENSNSHIN